KGIPLLSLFSPVQKPPAGYQFMSFFPTGGNAVVERKPSPNAHGARRRLILSQSPSAKVNDMYSIIADLAVAGSPEPVPFVVQLFAHERRLRRGTAPEIVVHGGGQGRRCVDRANAITRPVHQRRVTCRRYQGNGN